jgi:hypothetical protein
MGRKIIRLDDGEDVHQGLKAISENFCNVTRQQANPTRDTDQLLYLVI